MEGLGGSGFSAVGSSVKKKRSQTSRRPRPDSQTFPESRDISSMSSTPPSDGVSKVSSDENIGQDSSSRRKEFNLNQCALRPSSSKRGEGESSHKKIKRDDVKFGESNIVHDNGGFRGSSEHGRSGSDFRRSSEGVLAPANWKNMNKVKESVALHSRAFDSHTGGARIGESQHLGYSSMVSDGLGNENRLKKVKLKVGGVTRTIHAKTSADGASAGGGSTKSSRSSDAPRPRQKLILQDYSEDDDSPPDNNNSLRGVPWKDFSRGGFGVGQKEDSSRAKMSEEGVSAKQADKSEPVRKSKRVPKRRVLDGASDEGDEDEEIRYLERLKSSKAAADNGTEYEDDDEGSKKHRKISRVSKNKSVDGGFNEGVEDYGSSRLAKESKKKSRPERTSEDTDYVEEEDLASDGAAETKRKKARKELSDPLVEVKKEMTLTTRQRALQSGKDASSGPGASLIEFPDGLPPAPPRKQKEKLSEVEQQLKKAEAAQRRRMQVEKAAKESQAEAIRKILGQDSSRKKREDKMKKRREELAQEKAATAMSLASNTVRWVMGPNGTTVMFPKDAGLPSIFDPKPCSYPPPREKCAGPSCTNAYKYRDSKSNLPLCSLQCYKAVREKTQAVTTC